MAWRIYPLPIEALPPACPCGSDLPCAHEDAGYPWCRACMDHHRHPETCAGLTPEGEWAGERQGTFGDPRHPYQGREYGQPWPPRGFTFAGGDMNAAGPNASTYAWGVEDHPSVRMRFKSTSPDDY